MVVCLRQNGVGSASVAWMSAFTTPKLRHAVEIQNTVPNAKEDTTLINVPLGTKRIGLAVVVRALCYMAFRLRNRQVANVGRINSTPIEPLANNSPAGPANSREISSTP